MGVSKGGIMRFEYAEYNKKASNEELLDDLRRVVIENNFDSMSMNDYTQNGLYDCSTIIRRFGTWNKALELLDIGLKNRFWTEQELLDNLQNVWIKKGSQPRRNDMNNKCISIISSGAYLRKYGKWSDALKRFVYYINQSDNDAEDKSVNDSIDMHKTKRDVNLKLRFKVLQRDNFKCCVCGASPAKDPSVELQVDHILPWAKGGETDIDNLQTLCSVCNLGKSDIV